MFSNPRAPILALVLAAFLFLASQGSASATIQPRGLHLVGAAQMIGETVRLTSAEYATAGAVWNEEQVDVQGYFSTEFRFAITAEGGLQNPVDGEYGADGLVFVIQNYSIDALGLNGAGLGYEHIANSIALEFDTWLNSEVAQPDFNDPDGHHVSLHTRGTQPNSPNEIYSIGCVSYPTLVTVDEHVAKVTYESGVMKVYIDDLIAPVMTVPIDIPAVLDLNDGKAWLGFTSSTGDAWENHDLLEWTIEEVPVPAGKPTWGGMKALYR